MSYADKHALRDGQIVLYTRNGSPNFHARLKVDGVRGYIVKSSKTASLAAAVRWAEDLYDDLRYKARYGLEVRRHSFEALWKRWLQANEHRLSPHRTRYIRGTVERYLFTYFGDRSLEEVTNSCVEAYWSWRIAYWSSGQGTEKLERATTIRSTPKHPRFSRLGNIAEKPSQKTLQMEQSVLRQIFSWALRMGIIQRVPTIKAPAPHRPLAISRRPAFEREEWNALQSFLRDWAQGKGSAPEFKEREGRIRNSISCVFGRGRCSKITCCLCVLQASAQTKLASSSGRTSKSFTATMVKECCFIFHRPRKPGRGNACRFRTLAITFSGSKSCHRIADHTITFFAISLVHRSIPLEKLLKGFSKWRACSTIEPVDREQSTAYGILTRRSGCFMEVQTSRIWPRTWVLRQLRFSITIGIFRLGKRRSNTAERTTAQLAIVHCTSNLEGGEFPISDRQSNFGFRRLARMYDASELCRCLRACG